jgi:hypothetical protein
MSISHLSDNELIAKLHGFGVSPNDLLVEDIQDMVIPGEDNWCVSLGREEPIGYGKTRHAALVAAVQDWNLEWFNTWKASEGS